MFLICTMRFDEAQYSLHRHRPAATRHGRRLRQSDLPHPEYGPHRGPGHALRARIYADRLMLAAGSVCGHFVHHFLDIPAMLFDIIGAPLPENAHGRSLLALLRGEIPEHWPGEAYCEFRGSHMGLYSIRLLCDERYSYIYHPNDIDELYDHENDSYQLQNRAEDPAYAEIGKAMKQRMVAWMEATADHLHNEWTVYWLTDDAELAARAPGRRRTRW